MKMKALLMALMAMGLGQPACAQDPSAQDPVSRAFTIRLAAPGIKAGCKAELSEVYSGGRKTLLETKTQQDGVTVQGTVSRPTLVTLWIDDKPSYTDREYPHSRQVNCMVAPGDDVTVTAACFDSIPLVYEMGGTPLRLEPMVHIQGGTAQQHYAEWRRFIYESELAQWQAQYLRWLALFDENGYTPDEARLMDQTEEAAKHVTEVLTRRFVREHPTYAISLRLQAGLMEKMFAYTDKDLDSLQALFRENEDPQGLQALQKRIADYRPFVKGRAFTDLDVQTPDGKAAKLSAYLGKGQYTFVDFWASWCGPCRAAIPKVKAMAQKYADKLRIVSVSVDKDLKAWKDAMAKEGMPWTQLLAPQAGIDVLHKSYNLTAIPYLLLIDPDGRIVMSSHNPDEIGDILDSLLPLGRR